MREWRFQSPTRATCGGMFTIVFLKGVNASTLPSINDLGVVGAWACVCSKLHSLVARCASKLTLACSLDRRCVCLSFKFHSRIPMHLPTYEGKHYPVTQRLYTLLFFRPARVPVATASTASMSSNSTSRSNSALLMADSWGAPIRQGTT